MDLKMENNYIEQIKDYNIRQALPVLVIRKIDLLAIQPIWL